MKPRLILLNGNPGMGKTTLAQRYVDEHPMTLNVDIDRIWFMMGQWQASRPESDELKYTYAALIAGAHLDRGHDVIMPQVFESADICVQFEQVAQTHNATLTEIALLSTPEDAIERCKARARAMGYADGFRPGGVLDTNGRELKLQSMYENILRVVAGRPNTIRIASIAGRTDETYGQLLAAVRS